MKIDNETIKAIKKMINYLEHDEESHFEEMIGDEGRFPKGHIYIAVQKAKEGLGMKFTDVKKFYEKTISEVN